MMRLRIERALISRPVFIGGGAAAVALAALLTWVNLSSQLDSRQPVPSPDGKYFAYFDSIQPFLPAAQSHDALIVSTLDGHEVARFSIPAGNISWSNAGDMAVVHADQHLAVLIANSDGRFLPVKNLEFEQGTELRWSTDGTKIAYIQPQSLGGGISIYDFLQTRSSSVPLPAGFGFDVPLPLFWSPGSEMLFFLNGGEHTVVLNRVEVQSGRLQPLAGGNGSWRASVGGRPRLSPDGTKIYLSPPLNSVIDAQSGLTLWTLPPASKAGWSLWSGRGHRIFYLRGDGSGAIVAHDLTNSTDQVILNHAEPGGFFSADDRNYFHRLPQPLVPEGAGPSFAGWLRLQWGWQQEEVGARSEFPLGRTLLQPWEQSRDGLILASHASLARVRYGLYDPQSRTFADFVFPTDGEDLFRKARSQSFILASVMLYGALAFYVFIKLPPSPSVRTFYILSLTLMVLIAGLGAQDALLNLKVAPAPSNTGDLAFVLQGWYVAAFAAVIAMLVAFLIAYRHPPAHRAPHQSRWVIFALAVPLAGLAGRWLLHFFLTRIE